MCGKGVYTKADGSRFEGRFFDNLKVNGTYDYANGERYVGEFVRNKFNSSKASFYYANGHVYEGGFEDGKRSGSGVYRTDDGDNYSGEWKSDLLIRGAVRYKDGALYEGEFKDLKKHGLICNF
jgi:hypothetical protein